MEPGNTTAIGFLTACLNELGERKDAAYYLDFKHLIKTKSFSPNNQFKTISKFNDALEKAIYKHPTLEVKKSNRTLNHGQCTANLFDGSEVPVLTTLKKNDHFSL